MLMLLIFLLITLFQGFLLQNKGKLTFFSSCYTASLPGTVIIEEQITNIKAS